MYDVKGQNPFVQTIPVYVGAGMVNIIADKLDAMGVTKVMLFYDDGVKISGTAEKVVNAIKANNKIDVVVFDRVQSDPPDYLIDEIVQIARKQDINGIVSVGGGSTIDTGKAVKFLLCNGGDTIQDYLSGKKKILNNDYPMIKIPTTSGTGSEITAGANITYINEKEGINKKVSLFADPEMRKREIAIIDPELIVSCPPYVTAGTAFDVLAHAIESATSIKANKVAQHISYEAIRMMIGSVVEVSKNGANVKAREDMAVACAMAGTALAVGKVNAAHSFAHALGAKFHKNHGHCCAIFTPAGFEMGAEYWPEETLEIGKCFGVTGTDPKKVAAETGRLIYKLYRDCGLQNLSDIVPSKEEAYKELIPLALVDGCNNFSVFPIDEQLARWVIDRTYEYECFDKF